MVGRTAASHVPVEDADLHLQWGGVGDRGRSLAGGSDAGVEVGSLPAGRSETGGSGV
jgi:hypothetical protein